MNVLVVGAYERDNFGDLLFFYIAKKMVKNIKLVPSSVTYADMRSSLGEYVLPYDLLLNKYKWDAIWVVGGEIGAASIDSGLTMSTPSPMNSMFAKPYEEMKKRIKKHLFAPDKGYAYIPNLNKHPLNKETPIIINSIGGMKLIPQIKNINEVLRPIEKNDWISVRDNMSLEFFKSNGIVSNIAPDIVHTIKLFMPVKKSISTDPYICFQISKKLADFYGIEILSSELIKLCNEKKMKIKFVAAGIAWGHDEFSVYDEIKQHIEKNSSHVPLIEKSRDPEKIAETISNSSLWIGSSLHGRIVASAYSVPRISFDKLKVNEYSKKWDDQLPYQVAGQEIFEKSIQALDTTPSVLDEIADKLKSQALQNAEQIIKRLDEYNSHSEKLPKSFLEDNINAMFSQQKHILNSTASFMLDQETLYSKQVDELNKDNADLKKRTEALKSEIALMKQSNFWKMRNRYHNVRKKIGLDK